MEKGKDKYGYYREIIVRTTIMIVYEKINSQISRLYENCTILYLEIKNMENDRKVVKPTYQKWVNRVDKMKQVEL